MIQLHDKQFVPFISAEEIDFAIATMAAQVEADFADEIPVFVGVLNGAFMVVSDFMKHYKKPCEVSFIKLASYEGTASTNEVKQLIGLNQDLSGRTVIVIEDIVDTGNTVLELKELFKKQNVKHFKIATLSDVVKAENKIRSKARLDCICFTDMVSDKYRGLTSFINHKGQLFFYKTPCRDFVNTDSKRLSEWSLTGNGLNFSSSFYQ